MDRPMSIVQLGTVVALIGIVEEQSGCFAVLCTQGRVSMHYATDRTLQVTREARGLAVPQSLISANRALGRRRKCPWNVDFAEVEVVCGYERQLIADNKRQGPPSETCSLKPSLSKGKVWTN